MKIQRFSGFTRNEPDLLAKALKSFTWSPPTDQFRKLSSLDLGNLEKDCYRPEAVSYCNRRCGLDLFLAVGVESILMKEPSSRGIIYLNPELPRPDFK